MSHAATFVPLLAALASAHAATVQVTVQDAAGKLLPDAAVFLESPEARALAKPLQGAEMGQHNKAFDPVMLVVTQGTSVAFPNRDTVRHHVYSFSSTKNFELKLYAGMPANPVVFDRIGIAVLGCNIHDNMMAWVVVVNTPYFGRSARTGTLALTNVPPGNYRLRVWHSSLPVGSPAAELALTVGAGDTPITYRLAGAKAL